MFCCTIDPHMQIRASTRSGRRIPEPDASMQPTEKPVFYNGCMHNPPLHRYATRPGFYFTDDGGADAVVRSETADQLWLCIYEPADRPATNPEGAVTLDMSSHEARMRQLRENPVCTRVIERLGLRETLLLMQGPNYGLWYVHVPHAWDGMRYAYRADGAWDPQHGVRFNPYKVLLDPYSKGIDGRMKLDAGAFSYRCDVVDRTVVNADHESRSDVDSLGTTPISVALDDRRPAGSAEPPTHPHVPWSTTIVYELHVRGFTAKAPWLPPALRGTYAGLAHPTTIAYLTSLGVTSIELLPIQAKQDEIFLQERNRHNYWGYSTLGFFAPEPSYATQHAREEGPKSVLREVIDMVRALHEAGLEVIMDVVYNHTCEGGLDGPTVCWRGLDEISYYRHEKEDPARLEDTTGCGNTLDFTNTHVVAFAVDSLRYWSKRIGIDGFRFDLATSLARLNGEFTQHHPFLYALRSDRMLGNLKLIMEPWDLGHQGWRTGQFGLPFGEWNDRFRDTTRRFWLTNVDNPHDSQRIGIQEMATRLCGSADLFATEPGRGATSSINYATCHDGFTLTDLTRYARKHNEANGENGADGSRMNDSVNFGQEGPSADPGIERQRERAALNMLATLLLSLGTPMLLSGDEFCNTQYGNNNAYCQDNDITWLDWSWIDDTAESAARRRVESVSALTDLRKSLAMFHHEEFFTRLTQLGLLKPSSRVQWFLPDGTTPMERDWFNHETRGFAMQLMFDDEVSVLIIVNGTNAALEYHLPSDREWSCAWSSATAMPTNTNMDRFVDRARTTSSGIPTAWPAHASVGFQTTCSGPHPSHAETPTSTGNDGAPRRLGGNIWRIPSLSFTVMKQMPHTSM